MRAVIPQGRNSVLQRGFDLWRQEQPVFMWVPDCPEHYLTCQVTGLRGSVISPAHVRYGGIVPDLGGGPGYLSFPSNFGVTADQPDFQSLGLVSVIDPTSVRGCMWKLGGNSGDGLAVCAGNTSGDDAGANLFALKELVAWSSPGTNAFVSGLNCVDLGFFGASTTINYALTWPNIATGDIAYFGLAPSNELGIQGYVNGRGSNIKIHALVFFKKIFSTANEINNFRTRLVTPFLPFLGRPRSWVDNELRNVA